MEAGRISSLMESSILLILGLIAGGIITYLILQSRGKTDEKMLEKLKESFGNISFEILSKNTQEFLKLANETLSKQSQLGEKDLNEKKALIDTTLENMKRELQKVNEMVGTLEKDREQKFGELTNQLRFTAEQTSKLHDTTKVLKEALASSKARGQWGERMAEDILRLFGFVENINYKKQKTLEAGTTRPDFTFFLPQNLKVNMDVKFPLDNYLRYLDADKESEKTSYKEQFFRDVRARIKAVTTRDYINAEENTVDYVIVFIPNEQVYSFINEHDLSVLDEALRSKVIICSPLTLYAVLAVIRQSIENFNLQNTSREMLSLFGSFYKQWDEFIKSFDKLGKKIFETQEEFDRLASTRKNQLERPVKKIEELRRLTGVESSNLIEGETRADKPI